MGVVYKAHHGKLDLEVAVKLLHPHLVTNAAVAERFLREARLAARLNQPGLIRVFDCGEQEGRYFIVMELIEGQDLWQVIQSRGPLPVRRSLEITKDVARALGEALTQIGVIHRDVKPANIILTPNGGVKLADLGLAKVIDDHATAALQGTTSTGMALGTPQYMSPEQFEDASTVDHRADIFSLGATLYYMLSARPPFSGKSLAQLRKQIEEADPDPLPSIHVQVEELVLRMLAKNRGDRFQSYDELIEAVQFAQEQVGDGETIDGQNSSPPRTPSQVPDLQTPVRILRPATPPEDRVLLVVDIQNDFCPAGALGVPGGDEVVPVINELAKRFSHVIMTQDCHRPDHLSFASSHPGKKVFDRIELPYGSQRLWPDHCVQGTTGVAFHSDLDIPHCELVIRKGYNREIDSYSAFFENDRKTPTGLAGYLRERGLKRLFVVGLATDFCVAYSALDARKLGFEVTVIEAGCRGLNIDDSVEAAWAEMAEAGVVRA